MKKTIGIDIGSANIRLALPSRENAIISEPSVIAISRDNDREVIACGSEAKIIASRVAGGVKLVSPFSVDGVLNPLYVGALLKHIVMKSGLRRPDACISVSGRRSLECEKMIVTVLQDVGIGEVTTVRPSYAAGCGCDVPGMGDNVIVNIGASFVDMAAYCHSQNVGEVSNSFAGNAIDKAISIAVFRKYRKSITPFTAENIKLSYASLTASEDRAFYVKAIKPTLGLPTTLMLKKSEIRTFIESVTDEFCDEVISLVRSMPTEPDKIVLTGGGAKLEGLAPMLSAIVHFPVIVARNPELAVINGILQVINADIGDNE